MKESKAYDQKWRFLYFFLIMYEDLYLKLKFEKLEVIQVTFVERKTF